MRIIANAALCQGHARCADICPDVFTTDARIGKVVVRMDEIPPSLAEEAALAASNCPEGALTVQDE